MFKLSLQTKDHRSYLFSNIFILFVLICIANPPISYGGVKNNIFIDVALYDLQQHTIGKSFTNNGFHLFSHGKSGELLINGAWLQKEDIVKFLKTQNLHQGIQYLNIYGCHFAKGTKGLEAVSYIENQLQISVHASNNVTGKDGDWFLEHGHVKIKGLDNYNANLQSIPRSNTSTNPTTHGSQAIDWAGQRFTVNNCMQCTPIGWTQIGTPDISDNFNAGSQPHRKIVWDVVGASGSDGNPTIPDTRLPLPPNGDQSWISLRDAGFSANGPDEGAASTFTGLTVGETYVFTFYSLTATASGYRPGGNFGASIYSPRYLDAPFTVTINGQTTSITPPRDVWGTHTVEFLATSSSFNMNFKAPRTEGGAQNLKSVQISVEPSLLLVCDQPAVTITQNNMNTCGTDSTTFNYTVTNGPATLSLSSGAGGTLSTTTLNNGTSTFNYTPSVGDIGNVITITANVSDPDGNGSQCTSAQDTATVTVIQPAAPATTDLTFCVGDTAPLITTAVTASGTLSWYNDAAGTNSITTPSIDTSSDRSNTYYVSQTDGNMCESPTTPVTVTVNALPAAPVTTGLTFCVGDTAPLITTAVTASGTLSWYNDAAGTNSITTPSIDTSSDRSNTYYVSQTDGNMCESPTTPMTVTVNALPAAPATTDLTFCVGDTAPLITTAVTASGTLSWYNDAAGTNSITTPSIDTSSDRSNTYYVSQTDGNMCESPTTPMTVTVNALPAAPATTDLTFCVGDTAPLITTAVTASGTLSWYSDAAGTNSITTPSIDTSSDRSNTYYVSQTDGNMCESPTTPVTVTVNALPAAPATTGLTFCVGDTAPLITTAVTASGTLSWYNDAAGTNSITTPSIDTSSDRSNTYYVSQTDGNMCESPTTPVTVTVNALPAAPATTGLTFCVGDTAPLITTAVTASGTLSWYNDAAGTNSITTPSIDTSSDRSNTYYVSQTDGNMCESPTTPVTVTVNALPAAPATTGLTFCVGDTAPLITTAVTASGTLSWYNDAAGTNSITTPSIDTSSDRSNTYYVSQTDGNMCESPTTPVTVTVNALPAAPATTDLTFCVGDTAPLITTAVTASGTLSWYNDAAGTNSITTPSIDTSSDRSNTYYVSQTDGNMCESPTTPVTVTVNALPAAPVTTGLTFCVGDTAPLITTAVTASGTLSWYNDAAGTNSITTPSIDTSSDRSNTYYVSQTDGNMCESPTTPMTVTVNALPAAPATTDLTFCVGDTAPLITTAVTASGTLSWYNDAAGTNSITTPSIDTSSDRSNTYYVSQTDGNMCESPTTPVTVTVNALPAAPVTTGLTFCVGDTAPLITTAVTASGTLSWYNDAAGTNSITTPSIDTSSDRSNTYYVSQTDGNMCESPTTPMTVTVNALPAAPATTDLTFCVGDTAPLITTAVTASGTLSWYNDAAGTNSITTPSIDTSSDRSNTYYVSQTDGNMCESPTTPVTVTVNALPAAPVTTGLTFCVGDTAPLITTAVTASGTLSWYNDAAGTNSITTPSIDTSSDRSNTYYVSQTDGNMCESPTTPMTVTVNALPAAPATTDLTFCVGDTAPLITTAVTASGTLSWYNDAAGTNSITTPSIDTSSDRSNTYYVSQTDGNMCESPTTPMTVTVNALPAAPATTDLTFCVGDTAPLITTAVTASGTLSWYNDAAGTNSITTPSIDTSSDRSNTYYVSQTDGNMCESPTTPVTVTVNALPAAPVTTGLTFCVGDTAPLITTAVTASGTLSWYNDAAGTNSITTPSIDTSSDRSNTYYVSQTDGNMCESPTTPMTVTVNALPAAPATTDLTFCVGDTAPLITTAVTASGTLSWYNDAAGTNSITTPSIDTSSDRSNTYYVSQTDGNMCESPTTPVTVTVNALPAAPATTDLTFCVGDTAPLITTAVTASGTLSWYNDAAGTNSITTPSIDTSSDRSNTYYVSQTDGNMCESPTTPVTVTVNALPAAPATTDLTFCVGDTAPLITTAVTASGTLSWYNDAAGTNSITTPSIDTSSDRSNTYYVSQTDGNMCESPTTPVTVTVNALPAAPATTDLTFCVGDTAPLITTAVTASGTLSWYNDAAGTNSITTPSIDTSSDRSNTYYVSQTDGNMCESPTTPVTVTVNALPAAPVTTGLTFCVGDTAPLITTAVTASGTLSWYNDAAGTNSITTPSIDTSSDRSNTYYVSQTDGNMCESPTTPVTVTVNALPAAPVTTGLTFCVGDTAPLITTAVTASGTLSWYNDAAGTNSITTPSIDTSSDRSNTYYVSQTDGNMCESPTTPMTVTVNALPAAPATTDLTFCVGDTAPLITTAVTASGTLSWYNDAAGTNSITTPSIDTSSDRSNTYYVSQTDGNMCESPTTPVTVTVNALPAAPASFMLVQPSCANPTGSIVVSALTLVANQQYILVGINPIRSPQTNTRGDFTGLEAGVYEMFIENIDTSCRSLSTNIIINSNPDTDCDGNPDMGDPNANTPTATDDSATTPVSIPVTVSVLDNDDFLDNNDPTNLGTTTVSDTGGGTAQGTVAIDPTTGAVTYTPTPGEAGTDVTIIYEVCNNASGGFICDTATITIAVTDEDTDGDGNPDMGDPNANTPTATDDSATTPVSIPVIVSVLDNDDFLDNNDPTNFGTTTVSDTGGGTAQGAVAIDPTTGAVTYTPTPGEAGTDVTIIYEVCNNASGGFICDTATITIAVTDEDTDGDGNPDMGDPNANTPTATDDSATTPVSIPVTVSVLDNDDFLDNNDPTNLGTTTVSDTGGGTAQGTVAIDPTTGAVTYTPTPGEAGTDVTIIYEVCNNASGGFICDTATITIAVTDEDTDGDGNPDMGDPNANTPTATDDSATTPVSIPVTVSVLDNDDFLDNNDPTNLGTTTVSDTGGGTAQGAVAIDPTTGAVTYTPTPGEAGTDVTIIYEVCNNASGGFICDTATITIAVTDEDTDGDGNPDMGDPNANTPTATDDSATTPVSIPVTVSVLDNDDFLDNNDPTNLGTTTVSDTGGGTAQGTVAIDPTTGAVTYTPTPGEAGTDVTIIYEVCNNASGGFICDTATITIAVTDEDTDGDGNPDIGDPNANTPTATDDSATTPVSIPVTVSVLDNDDFLDNNDPTNLGTTTVSDTGGGTAQGTVAIDPTTGAVTYTPTPGEAGTDVTIIYEVCNNASGGFICDTATITIAVTDEDTDGDGNPDMGDPNANTPTATDDSATTPVSIPVTVSVLDNDDFLDNNDPTNLGTTTVSDTGGGTAQGTVVIDPTTGAVTYTPTPGEAGTDVTIIYEVCNNASGGFICDTATITIAVTDEDTDGDGNPDMGDPNANTPTATDDSATTPVSIPVTVSVLDNDDFLDNNDPTNLGTTTVSDTGGGTAQGTVAIDPTTGAVTYTPTPGEAGTDVTIIYEVCNNASGGFICDTATITIAVTDEDTDGDGNLNQTDPDPQDPCVYDVTQQDISIVTSGWSLLDCDGDGDPNHTDPDPQDPCVYDVLSQDITMVVASWDVLDCDDDGMTNKREFVDGTNPLDPCDLIIDSQTEDTSIWGALDCDGDHVSNGDELNRDSDNDGIPDFLDNDDDGDGVLTIYENPDPNADGSVSDAQDTDGDGIPDYLDIDDDGDGIVTEDENPDPDGNGIPNDAFDSDGDNIPDYLEPNNSNDADDSLEIFNVMTPNGDGKNDVFTIRNIELYPDNTLMIYNRWGILIYQVDGYGQNGNYFKGFSDGRSTIKREETLPVGTYFYTLRYNNNTNTVNRSGYLYINR